MDDNQNNPPAGAGPNQPDQPIDSVKPTTPTVGTEIRPDIAAALAEPNTETTPATAQSAAPEKPTFDKAKKSNKKRAMILWIVGVIVVLAAAVAVWWFAYFNNDKVILKGAFNNLVSQQSGTMDMNMNIKPNDASAFGGISEINFDARTVTANTNGQADFSVNVKGETFSAELTGALFAEPNGTFFIKVGGLTPLVDTAIELTGTDIDTEQQTIVDTVKPIVKKIDNQWIEISQEDINALTGVESDNSASEMKCLTNLGKKLADDSALRQNLFEAFQSEDVLNVKRVGQDADGIKYELGVNGNANLKRFSQNLAETDFAKQALNCMNSTLPEDTFDEIDDVETATSNIFEESDVKIYFWVDRASREARRMELIANQDGNTGSTFKFTMTNDYSAPSVPTAPTDTINLQELINDIQSSIMKLVTQSMQTTSSQQTDEEELETLLLNSGL